MRVVTSSFSTCRVCLIIELSLCLLSFIVGNLVTRGYDRTMTPTRNEEVKPERQTRNYVTGAYTHQFQTDLQNSTYKLVTHKTVTQKPENSLLSNLKPNPDAITSAHFSSYHLMTLLEQIVKGSMIHVAVEARDQNEQPMTSGGDYWFAVMSTQQPHQASTTGRVVDYNNGTYSAYFYAAWSGYAEINITLVHPSKAVQYLHDKMWNIGPKVFWSATYQKLPSTNVKTQTKFTFDTSCWVTSKETKTNSSCEYPPTRDALGNYTFVCKPPKYGHCRPLDTIAVNDMETNKFTRSAVGDHIKYFESQYFNQRLTNGPQHITISVIRDKDGQSLPKLTSSLSHGYWTNYTWTSFLYDHKWTNAIDMRECLRNKTFILLGDSTSRQWAFQIPHLLQLPKSKNKVEFENFFFENRYTQLNLTVKFRFHPQTITPEKVPFRLYRYFVDIIDSIPTHECKSSILLLSPWAHFPQWTRDSFIQRLVKLKEAVIRLRARCPNIPILVKGGHLRNHQHDRFAFATYGWSDYTLQRIGLLLKEVFTNVGIWFLDVWDMNESYPCKKEVHMPNNVVEEELKLGIAYLCHRLHHNG